ncbi:MAG: DnaJ domain-containing protein [Candidatus Dadabacteria bacterium]|nr:DnaJ domain-containing protein [Candidatus Dadabacteria bacterium]
MLKVDRKEFEKVIEELVRSKDIRELIRGFSTDTVYFYSLLKDISRGEYSPNYKLIKKVASDKMVSEQFIVKQAKAVLSYLAPEEPEEDYYKILGVLPSASAEEIRKAWLLHMKTKHPDKAGELGLEITKKLNEAYSVLGNPLKRSEYEAKRPPQLPVVVKDFWTIAVPKKLIYSISPALVVFFLILYLWGSGLVFRSYKETGVIADRSDESTALPWKTTSTPAQKGNDPFKLQKLEPEREDATSLPAKYSTESVFSEETKFRELSGTEGLAAMEMGVSGGSETPIHGQTEQKSTFTETAEEKTQTQKEREENIKSGAQAIGEMSSMFVIQKPLPPESEAEGEAALLSVGSKKEPIAEKEIIRKEEKPVVMPREKQEIKGNKYVVTRGDNREVIARGFDTSVKDLKEVNDLRNDRLNTGDVLDIPHTTQDEGIGKEVKKAQLEKEIIDKITEAKAGSSQKFPKLSADKKSIVAKGNVLKPKLQRKGKGESGGSVAIYERELFLNKVSEQGLKSPSSYPDKASLSSFVSEYVSAYKDRDMNRFISFFESDAKENGVVISKTLTTYRNNFSSLEIMGYDVQIKKTDFKEDSATIDGDFVVTFKRKSEQRVKSSNGTISWILSWRDNKWHIKEINYRVEETRVEDG